MTRPTAALRAALASVSPTPLSAPLRSSQTAHGSNALHARIRGEFQEMPGLSLTLAQAARLFGLTEAECSRVLDQLAGAGVLCLRPDGRYAAKLTAA